MEGVEHEQGVEEMEEQEQMRVQLNRLRRLHTAVFAAAFAAAMRFMLLPLQIGTRVASREGGKSAG